MRSTISVILINSLLIIMVFNNSCIGKKKNDIDLYPSALNVYKGHETDIDAEGGDALIIKNLVASSKILDKSGIDYSINNAYDGQWKSAWCINGSGIGEWIKVDIPMNQYLQKGKTNVYRILIVNGLAANKELYFANNRIKKIKVEFSEGEVRILNLKDGILEYQRFKINIKSKWIKLTILEIYNGKKYNDTCISEIDFEAWQHPNDKK